MMRRFVLLFMMMGFILSFGSYAMAQPVTGHVVDEKDCPLAYVSLMVFNPVDTSFVQGTISQEDGSFSVPVAEGRYLLRLSLIGYETLMTI